MLMSQLVNYSIIEAGLRALADKEHLAIGECESDGSIINTIGHELLHVVSHICEQDGINMMSEEPCYMMGSLCEGFFKMYC